MKIFLAFGIFHFRLHTAQHIVCDTASDEMTRLKGINYYLDKQEAAEDINCFPSELGHMAEVIIRNKWNKPSH